MPFSSTQMKALCLQAQHWTLRITSKAFRGWMGCVQCCGCGLYNLAALGNYKDKWREAQCITHPVSKRGLRLGNFVFSKAAHTPLVASLFLPPTCVHPYIITFPPLCLLFCLFHLAPSLNLPVSVLSFTDRKVWKRSFSLPLLHKLLFNFLQLQMLLPAHFKWNKRVSCFCSSNLFHVLFGRLFHWPSISAEEKWK